MLFLSLAVFMPSCKSIDIECSGFVIDESSSRPVSGASIKAYYQPYFFESFPPGIRKPVLLSSTITAEDGSFRIAITKHRGVRLVAEAENGENRRLVFVDDVKKPLIIKMRPFLPIHSVDAATNNAHYNITQ